MSIGPDHRWTCRRRPVAPLAAAAALRVALGAPFLAAGALKCVYDVGLFVLFRGVNVETRDASIIPAEVQHA